MKFVEQFSRIKISQNSQTKKPIAVFDSGLGGISILRELCTTLPNENYWYYGDSANAPYGTKPECTIRELTCHCIDRMIAGGAKAVVLACNTATSAAALWLRRKYPLIPIIGIEPEIKTPALAGHKRILVMATPMTLQLEKFHHLFDLYRDKAEFVIQPCPGLSELIEQGPDADKKVLCYLDTLLDEYRKRPIDAVVLGCTHYLHIKTLITKVLGPHIKFYDGASGAARELKRQLAGRGILNPSPNQGELLIENSSTASGMIALCKHLFQN